MGGGLRTLNGDEGDVVPLGVEPPAEPPAPARRGSALHTLAVSGMSLSALVGIVVLFLSIGIGLPATGRRVAIGIVVGSAVAFLACASAAVFTAARETYPSKGPGAPE
ncbi:MAG TPA: hypothetical protein VHI71_05980 [Actinomycetota bacterium]|nr:hypothetical protein [Actinomycetota bacterium]